MLVFAVPLSLRPICSSDRLKACATALSSTVYCPSSIPRSAVRRLHSFIRSPFVDGLPSARLESPCYGSIVHGLLSSVHPAVCRPRFAVSIRLFVPHSLTVFPPPGWKASPSTVHGLLSIVHPAVCRPRSAVSIRLFVPHSLTVFPPPGWKACPATVHLAVYPTANLQNQL